MVEVVYILLNLPRKLMPTVRQWRTAPLVPKMGTEKVGAVFKNRFYIDLSILYISPFTYKSNFYPRIVPAEIIYFQKVWE